MRGVRVGTGGWFLGFPRVRLIRGSTVEIGNDVNLCSWGRFNPLDPNRKLSFVTGSAKARIVIGHGTGISNSVLSCRELISIGSNTLIGAECLIVDTDFHGLPLGQKRPELCAPVIIGNNVFIGARCIVLKGVTIGDGAVIGAGSVVVKNIPPNSLAAGNPARVIRQY